MVLSIMISTTWRPIYNEKDHFSLLGIFLTVYIDRLRAESPRAELSSQIEAPDRYDTVFLGFPNWWGDMPMAVYSFLDEYDLGGKTIVPFCTSGGSGLGSGARNLHSLTSGADWLEGRRFGGGTSRNTVIEWVNGLGPDITAK